MAALELEEPVEDDIALAGLAKHGALRVRAWSIHDGTAHRCPPASGIAESWRKLYHRRRLGARS